MPRSIGWRMGRRCGRSSDCEPEFFPSLSANEIEHARAFGARVFASGCGGR